MDQSFGKEHISPDDISELLGVTAERCIERFGVDVVSLQYRRGSCSGTVHGKALDGTRARLRAVMEAVERNALSVRPANVVKASYQDLIRSGVAAIDPRDLVGPKTRNDLASVDLEWAIGRDVLRADPRLQSRVFRNWRPRRGSNAQPLA